MGGCTLSINIGGHVCCNPESREWPRPWGEHAPRKRTGRNFRVPRGPAHTWLASALDGPSLLLLQRARRTPGEPRTESAGEEGAGTHHLLLTNRGTCSLGRLPGTSHHAKTVCGACCHPCKSCLQLWGGGHWVCCPSRGLLSVKTTCCSRHGAHAVTPWKESPCHPYLARWTYGPTRPSSE